MVPYFIGDLPIPPEVDLGLFFNSAKSDLKKNGVKQDKFFVGGHSMGGSSIASWAHTNTDKVKGVFVMGAYAAKSIKDPAQTYGVPFLTVGA